MRRLLGIAVVLLTLFFGGLTAVRTGSSLVIPQLAMLMTYPDGSPCAAPCLFGIRPGHTLRQQVPGLLRQHPFVRDNSTSLCLETYGICEFRLHGFDMSGIVVYGLDNKVIEVYLALDLSSPNSHPLLMGDFIDVLGLPDKMVPHYACCSSLEYGRAINWIDQFSPTFGFWFYFTSQGVMAQDYATISNGVYQLRPDAPVLGFRVFSPIVDDNSIYPNKSPVNATSPWDRWYGFTSAERYFALAGIDTKSQQ